MNKYVPITTLAVVGVLATTPVSAAYFDLSKGNFGVAGGTVYDSVSMTSGGIGVTIEAFTIANNGFGAISGLTALGGSTGVYVSGATSGNVGVLSNTTSDGTNMDGGNSSTDLDEGLLFTFSHKVSLDFINLDSFTSSVEDFNLTVDGVTLLVDFNANDSSPFITNTAEFDKYNVHGITGTEFLIWADGDSDSFRVGGLEATLVPVPAAFWLFASGLMGLAAARRRVS